MASYTLRIDEETKAGAASVAEYYGLDLASVTRAFYRQMVRTHAIPLTFESEEPNEESLEAIRETEEMMRTGSGRAFACGRDLIEAALA